LCPRFKALIRLFALGICSCLPMVRGSLTDEAAINPTHRGDQAEEGRGSRKGHYQTEHTRVGGFPQYLCLDVSRRKGSSFPRARGVRRCRREPRPSGFLHGRAGNRAHLHGEDCPALGISYGGHIAILPGQSKAEEFSTLVTTTLWLLDSSPRRHKIGNELYLKDKFHSDLQNARRIISADTAEDTCWIDGRGDCTEV
jgi:hypothetical protein